MAVFFDGGFFGGGVFGESIRRGGTSRRRLKPRLRSEFVDQPMVPAATQEVIALRDDEEIVLMSILH